MDRHGAPGWVSRLWHHPVAPVVLLFVVVAAPFVEDMTAQAAPRFAFAAAVVDDGTIRLDDYERTLGIDVATVDGHLVSDKAPGQMVWSLPFYAVARSIGAESAATLRVEGNLGLWWIVLWSSLIPTAAILVLMWHHLSTVGVREPTAAVVVAVMGLGTPLLPFATELYGHALAAVLGYAAWLVLRDGATSPRRAAAAGVLAGAAVTVEYPMVLVAAVLGAVLAARRHWSGVLAFAGAGLAFLPGLLWYHTVAFGGPFETGYSEKPLHEGSPVVVDVPQIGQLLSALAGRRGLLLFSPVLVIALVGMVRLARRAGPQRIDAIVGLAVFSLFVVMQSGMPDPWGGDNHGPRYALPALPFLAIGLGHAWRSFDTRRVLAGFSVVCMLLVTAAYSLIAMSDVSVLRHAESLLEDGPEATLFTLALGPAGWLVHLGLVVAVLVGWRRRRAGVTTDPLPASVASG